MSQSDATAPRDFATLRACIVARAPTLPRRLAQVGAYALDHPDELAFGTAAVVAAAAGVQPSTLVRFSQALGYRGFSDLQAVFRARLVERAPTYEDRLNQLRAHGHSASAVGALLDGFSDAAERSIAAMRASLDAADVQQAAELIGDAETVYIVGLRRSFAVAAYLSYALGQLGIRNVLVDGAAGLGPEQAGFATARDTLLAISFAPYASQTLALTGVARERGARVVCITDAAFSPLVPLADLWLEVAEANFEGFRSLSATMALAMTLAVAAADRRRDALSPASGPTRR